MCVITDVSKRGVCALQNLALSLYLCSVTIDEVYRRYRLMYHEL